MRLKRFVSLSALLVLVIANLTLTAAQSTRGSERHRPLKITTASDQWFEVNPPDGDFTAAFPVKPEYIIKNLTNAQPTRNNHIFLAQNKDHTFMVSYMDITVSPGEEYDEVQQKNYREAEVLQAKRKDGWELLNSTNLAGNGYQHIYFTPPQRSSDSPAYFRAITFVRGTRVYLITYDAAAQSELFGPEAQRFFNSFKFTAPAAVQNLVASKWFEVVSPEEGFAAAFPVKPIYSQEGTKLRGQIEHTYKLSLPEYKFLFLVSVANRAIPANEFERIDNKKLLREAEQDSFRDFVKAGWRVLSRRALSGNGIQDILMVPGKTPSDLPVYLRAITFIRGNYIYIIEFSAATQEALFGPEARRFFNSFHFTNQQAG